MSNGWMKNTRPFCFQRKYSRLLTRFLCLCRKARLPSKGVTSTRVSPVGYIFGVLMLLRGFLKARSNAGPSFRTVLNWSIAILFEPLIFLAIALALSALGAQIEAWIILLALTVIWLLLPLLFFHPTTMAAQEGRRVLINGNVLRMGVLLFMGSLTLYLWQASNKYTEADAMGIINIFGVVGIFFYIASSFVVFLLFSSYLTKTLEMPNSLVDSV